MVNQLDDSHDAQRGEQIVQSFNEADVKRVEEAARMKPTSVRQETFEAMQLQFEKLSPENLEEAKVFADKVFTLEGDAASKNLEAIIAREANPLAGNQNYWIAKDVAGNLAGITGLYELTGDRTEHCWLGWFALQPELRGRSVGTKMLDFTIREAVAQKKTDLYIAASDHPDMAGNAKFYHQNSCPIVAVLNSSGNHIGSEARELSQPIIRGIRDYYQTFIDAGFNMMIRRRSIGGAIGGALTERD